MTGSLDAWMQHLENHGLLTLHKEAQKVGYRVRVATDYIFDMEYEGGLGALSTRENSLRRFQNSTKGIEEARSFLSMAKREIEKANSLLINECQGQPSTMQPATYASAIHGPMNIFRGVTREGKVICVDALVMEVNKGEFTAEELASPDGWLASANDGENVWIAANCEACGQEFRPIDGYFSDGEYSYCADCCKW